jgi:DNA-binding NarL/FixJ family response regulator
VGRGRPRGARSVRCLPTTRGRCGPLRASEGPVSRASPVHQRRRIELAEAPEPSSAEVDPLGISAREAELRRLGHGRTNRQIADELFISEKTASVHVTRLLRKLRVASRVEAAAVAQRLEPPADV